MRLSAYPLLVAGVSLVTQQVAALPVRVIVVSSHQEVSTNLHDSLHNGPPLGITTVINPAPETSLHAGMDMNRRIGCMGSLREKARLLSNKLLGFPALNMPGNHAVVAAPVGVYGGRDHEHVRVALDPFIGTPMHPADVHNGQDAGSVVRPPSEMIERPVGPVRIVHIGEDGNRMRFRHHRGPFLRRLHFALMALGQWEGRAVAFVLGCGIGVLLRMVWVLTVVVVRAIGGHHNENEEESAETIFIVEPEQLMIEPPPQYSDEKVAPAADEKVAAPA